MDRNQIVGQHTVTTRIVVMRIWIDVLRTIGPFVERQNAFNQRVDETEHLQSAVSRSQPLVKNVEGIRNLNEDHDRNVDNSQEPGTVREKH